MAISPADRSKEERPLIPLEIGLGWVSRVDPTSPEDTAPQMLLESMKDGLYLVQTDIGLIVPNLEQVVLRCNCQVVERRCHYTKLIKETPIAACSIRPCCSTVD